MSMFEQLADELRSSQLPLLPYQRDAAAKLTAIMIDRGGAILADDVGLGKSYVAAAIGAAAGRAGMTTRLLVPAHLRRQWESLAIEARWGPTIETHDALRNRFVVPADRDELVIVDEAHRFRSRNAERYRALARLAVGRRLLLVTATPFCNRADDVRALVELFSADDDYRDVGVYSIAEAFDGGDREGCRRVVDAVTVRRTAGEAGVSIPSIERRIIRYEPASLGTVAGELEQLSFAAFPERSRTTCRLLLSRRLLSSPEAFSESLRRLRRFYTRVIESASRGIALTRRDYRRLFAAEEEEGVYQDLLFGELWGLSGGPVDTREVSRDRAIVERLIPLVSTLADPKRETVERELESVPRPAVVFATAIATAIALYESIRSRLPAALVTSRRSCDERGIRAPAALVIERFTTRPVDVLFTTDMSSEGLNLQVVSSVIHYDLPWNPVRLDQRNGRAARLMSGKRSVVAVYIVPDRRVERRYVDVLLEKERARRSLLGAGRRTAAIETEPRDEVRRARELFPELVRASTPQVLLTRRARAIARCDVSLLELLTRRYRVGVERVLDELAEERLTPAALARLKKLLLRNLRRGHRAD